MSQKQTFVNHLANETSPYLLQHAHNPVEWHPWSQKTLKIAAEADKPLLISIGYAACHWCHVMAHESFEDQETAKLMNMGFVCIKIDREERPDIDQVYMDAVQAMTGSGGWPLHCFAIPDGKPFYGGTYFPKDTWQKLLRTISQEYQQNKSGLADYAEKLMAGISNPLPIKIEKKHLEISHEPLRNMIAGWKLRFDSQFGGENRPPKFPMPVNLTFLLEYAVFEKDQEILDHLDLTLEKMALGGIYDQIGGGFSRYSTDIKWKVPHFEKMLYDNAQLISLYSHAYKLTKKPLYKRIVGDTYRFLTDKMKAPNGLFYSSLDADSEGQEGKFYTWHIEELQEALGQNFKSAEKFFKLDQEGIWEHDQLILLRRDMESANLIEKNNREEFASLRKTLQKVRKKRVQPSLDDKSLVSWNGLMITALSNAYRIFKNPEYLKTAEEIADFILKNLQTESGGLYHSFSKGAARIHGFLEDYAFLIEGFLALHQASFDERWIFEADRLAQFVIQHFYSKEQGFFYFTEEERSDVIVRKMEIVDGVIPSSNATMGDNLFLLSRLTDNAEYEQISFAMLEKMGDPLLHNPGAFSKWGSLYMKNLYPFFEVAIAGPEANRMRSTFDNQFIPNTLVTGSTQESKLPILKNRFKDQKTLIYVCQNKVCQQPVEKIEDALEIIGQEDREIANQSNL